MKITYKGDYALKAVLELSLHYGKVVTIHDMAKRIDAPAKFLEQILLVLKKGGFVESRRGNSGGYLLARPPSQVTVGAIIRLVDGSADPISCVKQGYNDCADIYKCVFRKIWQNVYQATSNIIDNITFEALTSQVNSSQKALAYSI